MDSRLEVVGEFIRECRSNRDALTGGGRHNSLRSERSFTPPLAVRELGWNGAGERKIIEEGDAGAGEAGRPAAPTC